MRPTTRLGMAFCIAALLVPSLQPTAADSPPTCVLDLACADIQGFYDGSAGPIVAAAGPGMVSLGWLHLDPSKVNFQPLVDYPFLVAGDTVHLTGGLADLLRGAALAVAEDAGALPGTASAWALGISGDGVERATASTLRLADAGTAFLAVAVSEGNAWLVFVNQAGVTLASAVVATASAQAGMAPALANQLAQGSADYVSRKVSDAALRIVDYLQGAPTEWAKEDVNENGLGDRWEDTACRERLWGFANACTVVNGQYRATRSALGVDHDEDGLDLVEEFRWNSDPNDVDTDKDGLPDGPEANVWRRADGDLIMETTLGNCPDGREERACAWRHPDSFRDDDGDGLYNMGQDPNGLLAAFGAGDADSDGEGATDGDEVYGCRIDPAYGANQNPSPGIAGFSPCGGQAKRGHASDPELRDTDADGLEDAGEAMEAFGTNPQAPDTDADTWQDGPEAGFWGDRWLEDLDRDGIRNNLADPDSDRDGLQDGVEDGQGLRADLPDSDGDGMPDHWELRNLFDPRVPDGGQMGPDDHCLQAAFDADTDDLCNAFEYAFGRPQGWNEIYDGEWQSLLDPRQGDKDGDNLRDGAEVFPGRIPGYFDRYAQQQADPMDPYEGKYYYRWDASYPGHPGSTLVDRADTDGDGVSDLEEEHTQGPYGTYGNPNEDDGDQDGSLDGVEDQRGTNVAHWDTDRDRIPDGQETDACANASDCDNDQLVDGDEEANGCIVGDPDSDDDNLLDGWEAHGTTPGDPEGHVTECGVWDTDFDFLGDGEEQLLYDIDPTLKDTDRDGLDDNLELEGVPNALHSAVHQARGRYFFTDDRCASPNPNRCTKGGATDPDDRDSDDDGLSDGEEVWGVYESVLCQGAYCDYWQLNPNQQDTDGDNLPGSTAFLDGEERRQDTPYSYFFEPYDPTHYDPDEDFLPDAEESTLVTDPFVRDTDHDLVPDGAEVLGFASDPLSPNSDKDSMPDLYDPDLRLDNDPPALGGWTLFQGDARKGLCLGLWDQTEVVLAKSARLIVQETSTEAFHPVPAFTHEAEVWDNSTALAVWDETVAPPMLCVQYGVPANPGSGIRQSIRRVELTFTDASGNALELAFGLTADWPDVSLWQWAEHALCYVPFGIGMAASIMISEYREQGLENSWGYIELSAEVGSALLSHRHPWQPAFRVVKAVGTVACLADTFLFLAQIEGDTQHLASMETVYVDPVQVDQFTTAAGQVLLKVAGFEDSRPMSSSAGSTLAWRGDGYTYLLAKHSARGWTQTEWHDRLQAVFSSGSYAEDCGGLASTPSCYTVVRHTLDGTQWTAYVRDNQLLDVELVD